MLAQGAASEANKPWADDAEHMKTVALIVAVFVVWAVFAVLARWLFPPKPERWERMEEMMNEGVQTSLRLLGFGAVSVAIVFACAILFGFI